MRLIILYLIAFYLSPIQSFNNYEKYEGYKIYDIFFKNLKQNAIFYNNFKDLVEIIIPSRTIEIPMRVLIAPANKLQILEYCKSNAIHFRILNENVAESIKREQKITKRQLFPTTSLINFQSYQRFDVINNYLEYLQEQYPQSVLVTTIGKSYEGRDLKTILITKNDTLQTTMKSLIFIDAGIHAREWIAPATALYIIQQLVENATFYEYELNTYDWLVWPVVNPDGYEYSHDYDRLWRKTRQPANVTNSNCVGVDGNRNFDFYWGYSGGSTDPCEEIYQGPHAFSEPETRALRDLLFRINTTCEMYLTLHSFGNYMLYSWGYERSLPPTWPYLDSVARAGSDAIRKATGSSYTIGGAANILYPAAGGSDDFAFGVANISYVYCMELSSGYNFDPPSERILPIVSESWLGMRAMAAKMKNNTPTSENVSNCIFVNFVTTLFPLLVLIFL